MSDVPSLKTPAKNNEEYQDLSLKLGPKDVSLITVSKDMDIAKALLIVLRRMLADGSNVLFLLSNTPAREFVKSARSVSLDIDTAIAERRLQIVDCISASNEEASTLLPNVLYASSPSDLADVALKVSEAAELSASLGEKWLLVDSLTALTLYNTVGGILRFMQFLFAKLRMLNFDGVIIVLRDEQSGSMIQDLKRYCNNIIFLSSK